MQRLLLLVFLGATAAYAQTPIYPGGVATNAQLMVAKNRAITNLKADVAATDTSLIVTSTALFTANMTVSIDNEIISICSVGGSNTLNVGRGSACPDISGRGFDGTTAAIHKATTCNTTTLVGCVANFMPAWYHNALATEVEAIEQNALGLTRHNISSTTTTLQEGPTNCTDGGLDLGFLICRTTSDNFSAAAARTAVTVNQTFNGTTGTATGTWTNLFIPNLHSSSGAASVLGYVFQGVDGTPGGADTIAIGVHGECHNNSTGVCVGVNSETAQFAPGAGTLIGYVANAGLASGQPSVGTQHTVFGMDLLMSYPTGGTNPGAGMLVRAQAGTHTAGIRIDECGALNCVPAGVGQFNHMMDLIAYQSPANILELTNNNADQSTGFTNEIRFGRSLVDPADTTHLQAKILSDITISDNFAAGYLAFYTQNAAALIEAMRIDSTQNLVLGATDSLGYGLLVSNGKGTGTLGVFDQSVTGITRLTVISGANQSGHNAFQVIGNDQATQLMNVGSDGSMTVPAMSSISGTRFVCVNTAGKLVSSVTACSGT